MDANTGFWIGVAMMFVGLLFLFNAAFACEDLNYINDLAKENVETLDSCIGSVQKFGIESVECEVASHLPKVIWKKVNSTNCTLTKVQKNNLLNMNFALEAYEQVLAQGDVK